MPLWKLSIRNILLTKKTCSYFKEITTVLISSQFNAEVNNDWSSTSIPKYAWREQGNFNLLFYH